MCMCLYIYTCTYTYTYTHIHINNNNNIALRWAPTADGSCCDPSPLLSRPRSCCPASSEAKESCLGVGKRRSIQRATRTVIGTVVADERSLLCVPEIRGACKWCSLSRRTRQGFAISRVLLRLLQTLE